jgi:hypothetical protein
VDVRGAALGGLGDDRVHELDDRRVVGRLAQVGDLGDAGLLVLLLDRLGHDVAEAVEPRDERADVLGGHDGELDAQPGDDRQVVGGDDVRGVGDRDEQRALVDVGDRHRLQALGDRRRDEVGRGHVDLELVQVEVVEAVALGERAGVLVGAQGAALEQQGLRGAPGGARGLDGGFDALALDEAELHDHVGQKAPAAAPSRGRGQAGDRVGARGAPGCSGGVGGQHAQGRLATGRGHVRPPPLGRSPCSRCSR